MVIQWIVIGFIPHSLRSEYDKFSMKEVMFYSSDLECNFCYSKGKKNKQLNYNFRLNFKIFY